MVTGTTTSVPAWKEALDHALSTDKTATTYAIATPENGGVRVRHVIHRSFISAKPSLPLFVTTTDVRTPKVAQIMVSNKVEIAWWIEATMEQFRITGIAYDLPRADHPLRESFPAHRLSPSPNFDWEKERLTTYADKMSGHLRASFCRPTPGSPLDSYDDAKAWPESLNKPGEEESEKEKEQTKEALRNFSLLIVEPTEVEYLELKPIPNRRTKWFRVGDEWEKRIIVP